MKKVFVFLSTVIIAIFFLFEINQASDEFLFELTDNITLDQGSETIKKADLNQSLNQFARKNHSLIVKRIIIPAERGQSYTYQKFGKGKLTKGLKEASTYEQNTSSEISQYRVISGSLTNQQLGDYFQKMGYKVAVCPKRPVIFVAGSFLSNSSLLLTLIVLVLTFAAFTITLRIKDLRGAEIRLISGESLGSIMISSVKSDAIVITLAFLLGNALGILLFLAKGWLQLPYWQVLLVALFCYAFLLLLLSIGLSLIYFVGLRKSDLLGIIKGKLPLKRLIGIMAFCQLLAVIVVSIGI